MGHFTDNPIADAQAHIQSEDKIEHVYDYECNSCKHGFDHGHGVEVSDEKFCNTCIDEFNYIEFYQECGLTSSQIYELINSAKDL